VPPFFSKILTTPLVLLSLDAGLSLYIGRVHNSSKALHKKLGAQHFTRQNEQYQNNQESNAPPPPLVKKSN